MLYHLQFLAKAWGPFRLFSSHTFLASFGAALAALLVVFLLPRLWDKLPRDRGKALVKGGAASAGKPTGAGMILLLLVLPVLVLVLPLGDRAGDPDLRQWGVVVCLFAAMATGYFDDRADRPWSRTKKGLLDLAVSVAAALCLSGFSDVQVWLPLDTVLRAAPADPELAAAGYQPLSVPWWGHALYAVPILWITMNATNCTDGVDGLAGSLSLVALFSLAAFLYGVIGHEEAARYLLVPHDPSGARWAILCCVVGGGVAGYLWHNAAPSRVLMGDAGSRALGLLIGVAVLATGNPFVGLAIAPVILANGATGLLKILLLKGLAKLGVDTGSPDDATRGHWLARKLRSVRFPLHDHCRTNLGWSNEQVLVRFVLVQAALMPALFLLLVKIR
ncbi:MAG: phospho-N-acetylmuramoyl-pentapeptide-transferase [Kiritimatiellae bacterium]|nr:phospho-N-acetylmuramoyl-pentapeptide-transferase [Kiritimatiellia bacterium]